VPLVVASVAGVPVGDLGEVELGASLASVGGSRDLHGFGEVVEVSVHPPLVYELSTDRASAIRVETVEVFRRLGESSPLGAIVASVRFSRTFLVDHPYLPV
jgi:hypothetical protein